MELHIRKTHYNKHITKFILIVSPILCIGILRQNEEKGTTIYSGG